MRITILLIFVNLSLTFIKAQAKLILENNSQRTMFVKVMKIFDDKPKLYHTLTLDSYTYQDINFSESGYYFLKLKASIPGKKTIYQKSQTFEVINDFRGYSVITITFTISENDKPYLSGGEEISKEEFEKN